MILFWLVQGYGQIGCEIMFCPARDDGIPQYFAAATADFTGLL